MPAIVSPSPPLAVVAPVVMMTMMTPIAVVAVMTMMIVMAMVPMAALRGVAAHNACRLLGVERPLNRQVHNLKTSHSTLLLR